MKLAAMLFTFIFLTIGCVESKVSSLDQKPGKEIPEISFGEGNKGEPFHPVEENEVEETESDPLVGGQADRLFSFWLPNEPMSYDEFASSRSQDPNLEPPEHFAFLAS